MTGSDRVIGILAELEPYFEALHAHSIERGWTRDSEWTAGINAHLCDVGHRLGYRVFASRTPSVDGPEWLYDMHWREVSPEGVLVRIPLAMEIEWGFGLATLRERVLEDFLKLVQARADLRVMVFSAVAVESLTDELIDHARRYASSGRGDHYLFAGWGADTYRMHCRTYNV